MKPPSEERHMKNQIYIHGNADITDKKIVIWDTSITETDIQDIFIIKKYRNSVMIHSSSIDIEEIQSQV